MHFFKPHSIIATLLLVSLLGVPLFFLKPPTARALGFCGFTINIGGSSVGAGQGAQEVPVKEKEQRSKESLGDCLVGMAAKIAAKMLTQSILNWINSGFKGDPTFVQDPKKFFGDVANEVSGAFIAEVGLSALCTPFRPQIQIALYGVQTYYQRSQCTLSKVVDNMNAFYDDFNAGGWTAWISTVQPQNNAFGSYFLAADEQYSRMMEAQQNVRDDANQSRGFLSIYECTDMADADSPYFETFREGGITGCKKASKTTPGGVIAGQTDFALSIGGRQLIAADEINEMIQAIADTFVSQLIKQGLSKLTKAQQGTGPGSIFEDPSIAAKAQLEAKLTDAIADTETYLAALTGEHDALEELIKLADDRIACWTAVDAYVPNPPPQEPAPPLYTAKIAEIGARKIELLKLLEESFATPEEIQIYKDLLDDLQNTDPGKYPLSIRRLLDLGDIITALTEFGKLEGGVPSQEMIDAATAQSGNYEGELIAANTDLLECRELPGGSPTATSTPPITP